MNRLESLVCAIISSAAWGFCSTGQAIDPAATFALLTVMLTVAAIV